MRKTGIDILGDSPWGTHFCQFYQTPQDLTEILVPYFRAGLEGNEFCMWITSPPLGKEEAEAALRQSVPGFGRYKQKGQIEILPHSEWYLRGGAFNLQRVLNGWLAKLDQALAGGFDGMRVTGNTAWLEKRDWKSFTDYEEAINAVVGKHQFITLCSYSLEKCGALEILDVIRNHQFALIKSDKGWEVIESSSLKQAREMQRVSEERYRALVELAPDAIVVYRDGRFLYANSAALRLYGAETLDQLRAKLVFDLIHPDDREIVKARMQRLAAGGATPLEEHRILRLDGTVVPVETIGGRIDYQGQPAVQLIIRDVTERRQAEAALRESETRLREQTELLDLADVLARDMGDRIILWNRGAERLYGWSKAEALGSVSQERFQTVFTQPLQEIKDTLFREGSWEGELAHTRKDGKRITVASHWTLHRNESGQPVAILEADTDITGLKRAEEALQKANEELEQRVAERTAELCVASQYSRSLIEASLDPLVTISPDGRITDVNRATELATGVTRERLIGSSFSDYFTEPEKAHEGYRKVIAEGLVRDYPLTIRHASGRTTEVLYNATVYRNAAGQMQGVFAAARDITERIAMERVLQDSEARYRSLVTASAQVVWTTNAQGEVVEDIPSWRAFTGQDVEEVTGWGWAEAVHPEDRERTRAVWIRSLETRTLYETEYRVRRQDGEYRHFAVRGVPVLENGGRVREWVGTCTDITEIKEAERRRSLARALLELFARKSSSKEYLDSVVEVIQAWSGCQALGIRIVDENGYIPYASCVGFPPEFLQLENMLLLSANSCCCVRAINQVVEDQDRALVTSGGSFCCDNTSEFIDHLPAAQQARYRGNCIKFGFLSLGVIPIRYREQVLGAIQLADRREARFSLATVEFLESMAPLIGEAIHRFRAEAELSRYRDHLEELVKQRTAELEAANARLQMEIAERQRTEETLRRTAEELARSNHDLEQFAYAASHDLQEPLRAVAGYVELLKHRYVDKLDAKALQFIAGAADGAVRMQGLITDLLAFSRVGTQGKGFEMTDIKTALDTALASLKVGIKEARAKITSDPLPMLHVDAMQFAQLLQNLIGNAIKFRSERQPEIHIGAKGQPAQWIFSVRDNGIGIDPQYADRIFLIFQRLHTRRKYPGTGIGLAICKRIVERHGGTIWVESQPEQGSTFYFTIPAREEHFQ